jgi:hypothetical protein
MRWHETAYRRRVTDFFGMPKPDPPALAGRTYAFRSGSGENLLSRVRLEIAVCRYHSLVPNSLKPRHNVVISAILAPGISCV